MCKEDRSPLQGWRSSPESPWSVAVRSGEVGLSGLSAHSHPATATGFVWQLDSACEVIPQASGLEPWGYAAWHMCWPVQ